MYLVDTSVIFEARRGSSEAIRWMRSVDPLTVHLSVVTLGEIMRSIALKQNSDPATAGQLAAWLRKLRHEHAARILPVTDQICVEWGRIAAIGPRGDIDGLVAATAIVHDLVLVTRDVADFRDAGVDVVSPWNLGQT